jgi:hypothetical protein
LLIKLKIFLYLILIIAFSLFGYKTYNKYQYIINLSSEDLARLINNKNYNNCLVNIGKINFKLDSVWINFKIDNLSLKLINNHSTVNIQELTGRINILSIILYNKINITKLSLKNICLTANIFYPKSVITELIGNLNANMFFSKKHGNFNIKMLLTNINNNINFNIETVINIDFINNNIEINKFKMKNFCSNVREFIKYLPEYFINNSVLNWLDQSLRSGSIADSNLLWTKDDFSWQVDFKDITLKYSNNWPVIQHLDAVMKIDNNNFKIESDPNKSGFINNYQIQTINANLDNIFDNTNNIDPLAINFSVIMPVAKILELLNNLSLKNFNNYQDKVQLSMKLLVPIIENKKNNIKYSGNFKLLKNNIFFNFLIDQNNFLINSNGLFKAHILLNDQNKINQIEELWLLDNFLGKVKFFESLNGNQIYFNGDNIKGVLLIDDYIINLETLKLNKYSYNNLAKINFLSNLNKFNINCKNFYLNNINLGEFNVSLNKEQGFIVNGLINSKQLNISSKLIQKGEGNISFNLQWPNYINELSLRSAKGEIDLNINKGTIIGIDPGLGRLIGLLSIENIQRRLMLDFSDITNSGFSFDKLYGKLQIDSGDLKIGHLIIQGPSAKMAITGKVLLSTKNLDLFIEVSNKIEGTISLAAAIAAGNPIVGAAIWLFNKTSGINVGELKVRQYKVTGAWDKPVIIEL